MDNKAKQRSKTGCFTCRRRKKKCDERHPTCTNCARNALLCTWPTESDSLRPTLRRRDWRAPKASSSSEISKMMTVFVVPKPQIVQQLLSHFARYAPMWLSTRSEPEKHKVLDQIIPLALENTLILDCVLTVAAADLAKNQKSDAGLHGAAVHHFGRAVAGLCLALDKEASDIAETVGDENLLAIMLLCLHETQNFSESDRLLPHLNAAANLIWQKLYSTPANETLRDFLIELFCYFCSLTAFSHGSGLALHQAQQIFDSPLLPEHLRRGTVMGISQEIFLTIFRVAYLMAALENSTMSPEPVKLELEGIQAWLQNVPMPIFKDVDAPQPVDTGQFNDAVTAELYRLACLLHLSKVLNPTIQDSDVSIQTLVSMLVETVHLLAPDSPSNSILCWPLVMAGMSAILPAHQRIIAARLNSIYEVLRSDIFNHSARFLRTAWKQGRRKSECQEKYPKREIIVLTSHLYDLKLRTVLA